ncbi:tRNA (carboxymethyluridine(34)-5-O)-methyltransferase, partial [Smittium mucronatum]
NGKDASSSIDPIPKKEKVYYRYYHLFKEGELLDIIRESDHATIVDSGYDRDNWFAVIQK